MRNRTLDMVKAICAYAVVLLHVHFPGNAGIIANVLARFAVPVFFMVSGYFCFRGDDTEFIRTGKKIRHVLKLMLVAFPVCCLWELIQNHIDGASQKEWLEALVSGEHIGQFLLYNNRFPGNGICGFSRHCSIVIFFLPWQQDSGFVSRHMF